MIGRKLSFKEKSRINFQQNIFEDNSPERLFSTAELLEELYQGILYPETPKVLKCIDLEPQRVKPRIFHFFGRRLGHLYGWFILNYEDSDAFRYSFNSILAVILRFRPLSDYEKNKIALWAKYYDEYSPGYLHYEHLVELEEARIYYDNIAMPGKRQINTLNYLSELAEIVQGFLPETLNLLERMIGLEIVNDDNIETFYLRLLEENNGTSNSVFEMLNRWYMRSEEI